MKQIMKKLARLPRVAAYNRDWHKYFQAFAGADKGSVETFRLRNGQILELKPDARFILNEIYLDRVYDLPGTAYSQLTHVLDLGANVGVYAAFVCAQNPDARIYCFEPASNNYQILARNVQRNQINATLYQAAVSVEAGDGFLSQQMSSVEYTLVESPGYSYRTGALRRLRSGIYAVRSRTVRVSSKSTLRVMKNPARNASDEWLLRLTG